MGVKSTRELTRYEAESLYVELKREKMERKLRGKAAKMSNSKLELRLEELNDARVNESTGTTGGGFDNYIIVSGG